MATITRCLKTQALTTHLRLLYIRQRFTTFSHYTNFFAAKTIFFVVYDKCGDVAFKPSLWFGMDRSVVYGGVHFSKYDKNTLFFPTNDGIDSIQLIPNLSECKRA